MQTLKAQVKNGRLLLDEPTDLPEGEVVYLQCLDGIVRVGDDDLDDGERAELYDDLEASLAEIEAGKTTDFAAFMSELRQRP